jgi:hypothetical protein
MQNLFQSLGALHDEIIVLREKFAVPLQSFESHERGADFLCALGNMGSMVRLCGNGIEDVVPAELCPVGHDELGTSRGDTLDSQGDGFRVSEEPPPDLSFHSDSHDITRLQGAFVDYIKHFRFPPLVPKEFLLHSRSNNTLQALLSYRENSTKSYSTFLYRNSVYKSLDLRLCIL